MRRFINRVLTAVLAATAIIAIAHTDAAHAQSIGPGIFCNTSATSTLAIGNAETTMASCTLPANALQYTGKKLDVYAAWSTASNSDVKTMKLYFGSESVQCQTSTSAAVCTLNLTITKSGSNRQITYGNGSVGTSVVAPVAQGGVETDTTTILIKATASTTTVNEATLQDFYVQVLN